MKAAGLVVPCNICSSW